MKKYMKLLICSVALAFYSCQDVVAQTVGYGRATMNTTLSLDWNADNYGNIQWQSSTDGGNTWKDIAGATSPEYVFKLTGDAYYRVCVDGDEACDPFLAVQQIKALNFSVEAIAQTTNTVEVEVSNLDLKDAKIKEYGYCINQVNLSRNFSHMYRVKVGDVLPGSDNFTFTCQDLKPDVKYALRVYLLTEDGSLLFSSAMVSQTLPGIMWSAEDWIIGKDRMQLKFEIPGGGSLMERPIIALKFGKNESELKEITYTKDEKENHYSSEQMTNLTPGTEYVAVLEALIDGEEVLLKKTVKTWSDYSTAEVDPEVKPVRNTIKWNYKELTRISPVGLQAEYPRVIRTDGDTLLCAYHGGTQGDYWVNIYLQASYDNGRTWKEPVTLMDKEKASIGSNYWRFTNPEMIKLKNGWILMSFTANGKPEVNDNCHVMVMLSKDNGKTWGDPTIMGRGRTWEPMIVQLPNGELELYVSSEAAWFPSNGSLQQEIVYSRSTDNGETWTKFERASFTPGCRDGMPVASVLQGNKGILFSIEVIGGNGPSIVKRDLNGEWDQTPWNGQDSEKRWRLGNIGGGGAPYMLQLPTGEIVVSAHLDQVGVWQTSRPKIIVGDNTGHNFTAPVSPLPRSLNVIERNDGAYYNSLFLKDDNTVWLVITHSRYNGDNRLLGEIMYMEGQIVEMK